MYKNWDFEVIYQYGFMLDFIPDYDQDDDDATSSVPRRTFFGHSAKITTGDGA